MNTGFSTPNDVHSYAISFWSKLKHSKPIHNCLK